MTNALRAEFDNSDAVLLQARTLVQTGHYDQACAAYLEVVSLRPGDIAVLHELGCVAHQGGYRSAARVIFQKIVLARPDDLIGHINLGNILYEDRDPAARLHFETVLRVDCDSLDANRGLGRILREQGELEAADLHWRRSFPGQAIVPQHRGAGIPMLMLVSAQNGNIPTQHILSDRTFAVTALYAEYYRPDLPLPPHALLFNAIGDADRCAEALVLAEAITCRSQAPVINSPGKVLVTGRAANASRIAAVPGVRTPSIRELPRAALADTAGLDFPLLLRSPGFHTGQHFVCVDGPELLAEAAVGLPGEKMLAIEYLDARGVDGLARKYRVMCIGGELYPFHMAASADWKVHYYTAGMDKSAALRAEEQRFLEDMPEVLGESAMAALAGIAQVIDLDYFGMDFALAADGSVLLFEANATMIISPPSPDPMWDYRRAPIARVADAVKQFFLAKAR